MHIKGSCFILPSLTDQSYYKFYQQQLTEGNMVTATHTEAGFAALLTNASFCNQSQ